MAHQVASFMPAPEHVEFRKPFLVAFQAELLQNNKIVVVPVCLKREYK